MEEQGELLRGRLAYGNVDFRVSKGLGTKLLTSTSIIVACAVLHNLSLILNDKLEDDEEVENFNNDVPVAEPHRQPGDGFLVRNALIERLFR